MENVDNNVAQCPACGEPLEAGAVVCMHCGFDLSQGRRVYVDKGPRKLTDREAADLAEYRTRIRQQLIIAVVAICLSFIAYTFLCAGMRGFAIFAPLLAIAWLVAGGAFMFGAWWVLCCIIGEEFGNVWHTAIKLAAIYLLIHTARMAMLNAFDLQLPAGHLVIAGPMALALLAPLAIIFIAIPMLLMFVMVDRLLSLPTYEMALFSLGLWAAHSIAFVCLKLTGMPG